jgi:hypothetical protein
MEANKKKIERKRQTNYVCNLTYLAIGDNLSQAPGYFWSVSYRSQFLSSHTDANFNSRHLILCLGKKKFSPSAQTKITSGGARQYTIWLTFIIPDWKLIKDSS